MLTTHPAPTSAPAKPKRPALYGWWLAQPGNEGLYAKAISTISTTRPNGKTN